MPDEKKNEGLNDAPDMSGAWRVIGATAGAFALLVGVLGPAMKRSHDKKVEKSKNDQSGPSPD